MDVSTESFVTVAKEFIAWVEAKPGTETAELKTAIGFVARLYTAALALEDVNPESDVKAEKLSHEEWKAIYDRFCRFALQLLFRNVLSCEAVRRRTFNW